MTFSKTFVKRNQYGWLAILLCAVSAARGQTPLSAAFTYQGRLQQNGQPFNGAANLVFRLYDASAGGNLLGTQTLGGVSVTNGLFTVQLNGAGEFGANAFNGAARWLEITVNGTPLAPRQPLTAAPYALYALNGPGSGGLWAATGNDIHNTNSGNVGIGVNSPAHALDISGDLRSDGRVAFGNYGVIGLQGYFDRIFDFSHTLTDFSSTDSWTGMNSEFRLEPTLDLTGANAKYFYSHFFWTEVPPGNPHDVEYMQGPYIYAGNNGDGTANIVAGAFISAQSDGDVVEHVGCEIGAWGLGANANITNNYALSLRTGQLHAGGSIGNNYALYISAPESVVDMQNNIGFYMADQKVAGADESWAIFSDGGRSYFADGINIGTTVSSPYKLLAISDTDHAIFGKVEANSGAFGYGVYGQSDSNSGGGGVFGIAPITGVRGLATATTGTAFGGYFQADSPGGWAGFFVGRGYFSQNVGIGTMTPAVPLQITSGNDVGLGGGGYLVTGDVTGPNIGMDNNEIMARNNGVAAQLFLNHNGGDVLINATGSAGNVGIGTSAPTLAKVQIDVANQRCIYGTNNSTTFATAYFDNTGSGPAGVFDGGVTVIGNLSKSSGSFRIDHPLDPANKYLYHSFVESPDMMNVYNGNIVTDAQGYATVEMPEWFETLNRDFRYQLTVIGQFAQAIIAEEMYENRFMIQTDKPNVKVSWQVTGIRQDPWANEHRIPVEQDKPDHERGKYQHPELYGQPREMGINHHAPAAEQSPADETAAQPEAKGQARD